MLKALLKGIFRGRGAQQQRAWAARVAALQQVGRHADAARACEERLAQQPTDVYALQALAAARLAQGHAAQGVQALEQAAALAPGDARLHATLARVQTSTGAIAAAIESYERAVELDPVLPKAADELVALLAATGRYDEAEDRCREALAAAGESRALRHALAGALFEQGRVDEALAELEAVLAADPQNAHAHHDFLRTLNYSDRTDPARVFAAHAAWGARFADPVTRSAPPLANDPDPERRLRVGYVSPYFRKHAVTFFLEGVFAHHDRNAFEVTLYSDVARPDTYSERLKRHLPWRDIAGLSDEALARVLREDAIDLLVDLNGHTRGHRLHAFARMPAPVQVAWWGYPNTTGMAAMRYRMSDVLCDPPGTAEALHTERLVYLPIQTSWTTPADAPEPGPLPALATGRITFGSFNSCYKITPTTVAVWSRVLERVANSRLLLVAIPTERARRRIVDAFARCGISAGRLELRPRLTHEAFLEAHREVDIALDTHPYNGMTTTCFSLWMGVPVVSLTGATSAARVGRSQLASIGWADLAPADADAFVAAAARLASDLPALALTRKGLRDRMLASPLTDGAACAAALERAYRNMWREWCATRTG